MENLFKQPYIVAVKIFFNLKKNLLEGFFVTLLFLVVTSFDSDTSLEGKPSDTDMLIASLPCLLYCAQT
jgi:hypothetical protein